MAGAIDSERSMMGEVEAEPEAEPEPEMDDASIPSPVSSWLPDIAV